MEKGEVMMKELMMHLSKELAKSLQENQIRKIHFIAKEKLRFYLKVTKNYIFFYFRYLIIIDMNVDSVLFLL